MNHAYNPNNNDKLTQRRKKKNRKQLPNNAKGVSKRIERMNNPNT